MVAKAELMKRSGLLGAGAGVGLFAIFGLLQGAVLGGTAGLSVAKHIFGATTLEIMANDLLPRIILAASMLAGVIVSLMVFVVAFACAGVAAGYLLGIMQEATEAKEVQMAMAKKD
jgi:hypothetical protein